MTEYRTLGVLFEEQKENFKKSLERYLFYKYGRSMSKQEVFKFLEDWLNNQEIPEGN